MTNIKVIAAFVATMLLPAALLSKETRIPAADKKIHYMGRIHWDESGYGSFNYPGTTAILNFNGSTLRMETSPGSGRFIIEADNSEPISIVVGENDSILTIAEGLENKTHNVRITYAIEGYEHNPQFRAFYTDGEIVDNDSRGDVKIEFIGNSITCGYGIEDEDPQHGFSYDTENHTLSYAHQTARALNAEFNVVARSGIGIYRNYGSPKEGDVRTMPLEYDYTMLYNHEHKWDPKSFVPDVICVNLGTNDMSEGNYDLKLLEEHYREFLEHLRGLYPNAKIVLLTGSMLQSGELQKMKNLLDKLAEEADNMCRFDMSAQTGELGYGANYHPSRRQAQKMAAELTEYLKGIVGAQ